MIARKIRFISHTGRFSAIFLPGRMDFVGAGRFSAISLPGRLFFVGAGRVEEARRKKTSGFQQISGNLGVMKAVRSIRR